MKSALAFRFLLSFSAVAISWSMVTVLPRVLRTPDSFFADLAKFGYPWQPNYINIELNGFPTLRMHYLDLGPTNATSTLLLLHGVPSWSFLYRKMIPVFLKAGFRVIAPDFIGFGRSDKLTYVNEYTHHFHTDSLLQLVRKLDLQDVTLFGQELGGPTGLSVVIRDRSRFKNLVLLNTLLPQGDIFSNVSFALEHTPVLAWQLFTSLFGRAIPIGLLFDVSSKVGVPDKNGYTAPFPSLNYKAGAAKWPLLFPWSPYAPMAFEMQLVEQFLKNEWTGPVLFGYSDHEVFTRPGEHLLRKLFRKNGCEVEVRKAGHFLQEDQGETVANLVVHFVNNGC